MNLKSAPATLLLGGLGLLLLAVAGWLLLLGPARADLSATAEAQTEAQDRNQARTLQLNRLRTQVADLGKTDALSAEVDTMFPPTADQPGFFAQVTAAADEAGVTPQDLTVVSPTAPEVVTVLPDGTAAPVPTDASGVATGSEEGTLGELAVQEVEVSARGDYTTLTSFLAGLEDMSRAFLVTSVEVQDSEGLTLTVHGNTYVAPPIASPDLPRAP